MTSRHMPYGASFALKIRVRSREQMNRRRADERFGALTTERYLFRTVFLPSSLILSALVPGLNFLLFTLHGGLGWLALYASGPVVLGRVIYGVWLKKGERLSFRLGGLFFVG